MLPLFDYYECSRCGMYHSSINNWIGYDCRSDKHRVSMDQIPPGATIYTIKEQMEDEKTFWAGIKADAEKKGR